LHRGDPVAKEPDTSRTSITTAVVALLAAAGTAVPAKGDIVTDWNNTALNAIKAGATPPPFASRALAIMHATMYDANNAISLTLTDASLGLFDVTRSFNASAKPPPRRDRAASTAASTGSSTTPSA